MTTNQFRTDNTNGYTARQLASLNDQWRIRGGCAITDSDAAKLLSESILREYDTLLSGIH